MLRDKFTPELVPEIVLPNQSLSPNLNVDPDRIERFHNLRRCVGTMAVAVSIWLSPSLASDMETAEAVTELGIHDIGNITNQSPKLEFHKTFADQAIDQTYQAFHLHNGFYIDNLDKISGFASTWHQYQLLNMFDIANTVDPTKGYGQKMNQALAALNTYWSNSPAGYPAGYDAVRNFAPGQPDRYVDDNLWIGQFEMHLFQKTGDKTHLDRAKQIMDLYLSQQQADGGAYWKVQLPNQTDRGRVMASNATAIPTLVELYLQDPTQTQYLTAAEKAFNWVQLLHDPASGLYFDNIGPNGQIDKTTYTYNQAEVLLSIMALNKVDPDKYPLDKAIELANTSMAYFSEHSRYGISKFDVIYIRALMKLATQTKDPGLVNNVQQNLALAQGAIHNSPASLADAASASALLALGQLTFAQWSEL